MDLTTSNNAKNLRIHKINHSNIKMLDNQFKIQAISTGLVHELQDEEEPMITNDHLDLSIDTNSEEDEDAPLKKRLKFEEEERVNSENIIILTTTTTPSQQQTTELSTNIINKPLVELQQEILLDAKDTEDSELGKRVLEIQSVSDKKNDNEMETKRNRVYKPNLPHRAIEIPIMESKGQPMKVISCETAEGEEVPVKDELEECVEDEGEVYDENAGDSNDECDYRNDYPDDNDHDADYYDDGYRYDDYGEGPTYNNGEEETYAYADGEEPDPLKKFSALKLLDDGGESSPSERYGGDDDSDYDDAYGNEIDESYDYGYNV